MAKYANFVCLRGQVQSEIRTKQVGQAQLAEFRLLITEPKRGAHGAPPEFKSHFFTVSCWREQAIEATQLQKGDLVGVIGKLKQDEFTDQAGNRRESVSIVADQLTRAIGAQQMTQSPPNQGFAQSFDGSYLPPAQPVSTAGQDGW